MLEFKPLTKIRLIQPSKYRLKQFPCSNNFVVLTNICTAPRTGPKGVRGSRSINQFMNLRTFRRPAYPPNSLLSLARESSSTSQPPAWPDKHRTIIFASGSSLQERKVSNLRGPHSPTPVGLSPK